MSAPGVDERLHRDAIVALVGPILGDRLYDEGEVPGAKGTNGSANKGRSPSEYTVLTIERDPALLTRTSGRAHQSAWAATFESASTRYTDNVRSAQAKIANTLEGVRLTVDGHESTPLEFESATAIRWETSASRFVGRWTCIYVL